MFKSKIKCDAGKVWKVIFIIWIIFASVYVIYGEYNRLANRVAKSAYNAGLQEAVVRIITESEKCQAVPINVGEMSAQIINLKCLQMPAEEE